MIDIALSIISILASGLLGVLISNWYHKRYERRKEKFDIFKQLMGNRNHVKGDAFTEALNSAFVVFYDSNEVKKALKEFHEVAIRPNRTAEEVNQKLLDLFKAMSKNLGIKIEPLTDTYFLQAYNIKNCD
ncbi:MAG: hypothetical protein N0A00_02290 [Candidatus Bathyarchaeota archaeon]|nr:hypothetical protein [Candidatus Bathyarchaeota archaeon]